MSDELLHTLLPAMEIAAFERRADGSFSPVAPPPAWFGRLTQDATFPFLGHILEEAHQFWKTPTPARRDWGPCAEVDETGKEFHYKVMALTVPSRQFLLFQLDPGSDWIREVLQKVRSQALQGEQDDRGAAIFAAVEEHVRRSLDEIRHHVRLALGTGLSDAQLELKETVMSQCDDLASGVDSLIRLTQAPRSRR
jgi:hypothetical protein